MWRTRLKRIASAALHYYRQGRFMASNLLRYGALAPSTYYVFADQKLIYISVPKVACTSIKITMGRAYQIEVADELAIHEHEAFHYRLGKPPTGTYTFFAFVRNPYARLVSCYRDKVVDVRRRYTAPHFMNRPGYYYPYQLPPTSSFEQFVKIISNIPDRFADNHFKSQYAILSHRGKFLPDFIGHLETIEHDWATFAASYGFDRQLANANCTSATGSEEHYATYYTPALVDLVYRRYQQDFMQLGYGQAREELLSRLKDSKHARLQ